MAQHHPPKLRDNTSFIKIISAPSKEITYISKYQDRDKLTF